MADYSAASPQNLVESMPNRITAVLRATESTKMHKNGTFVTNLNFRKY